MEHSNRLRGLLLAFSFVCCAQISYADSSLRFCEDPWPPYTYGKVGSIPTKGYAVDILNEVGRRANIAVSMLLLPWKRCLLMAEQGQVDGVMLLTKNLVREQYLDFSIPVLSDNNLLWFKHDNNFGNQLTSFADLKGYRIGVAASFNYGNTFNEAKEKYNLNIEVANDIQSNLQKLSLGRIDIFFVNLAAANEVFKENPELANKVTYVDKLFDKVPFSIAFSKKSEAKKHLKAFNKAIKEMTNDGTISRILQHTP